MRQPYCLRSIKIFNKSCILVEDLLTNELHGAKFLLEADSRSTFLWTPRFHYCVHKIFYHTKFQDPVLSVDSVVPTSEVHTDVMLILWRVEY
jgi:hypothetical protein